MRALVVMNHFLVDEVLVLRPRCNDYYFGLCWTTVPNKHGSHRSMRIYLWVALL